MIIGFFGKLGETIGRQLDINTPSGVDTIDGLRNWLASTYPDAAAELAGPRLKAAIDDVIVPGSAPLEGATHIEFFPPVSGG